MNGRIVKILSNDYFVNYNDVNYICKARGKFRNLNIKPVVGDFVNFSKDNYITEILPRKNELIRPLVSNVDQALIVCSVKEPDFSSNLLDKLLTVIEFNNIKPIIYLSKMDLVDKTYEEEIKMIKNYYQNIGYEVYDSREIDLVKDVFKDKVTVFTGQSGAGKSTLLNNLDNSLNILTAPISKALGRGKHTTRHVELFELLGGFIVDTPGFSAITLTDMKKEDIRDNFIEFNEYRDKCKYKDCMHNKEDDCFIKKMVSDKTILESRYNNYIKFISER